MKLKKILAGILASAVAVSTMAVATSAKTFLIAEGEAILGFGDADWKVSNWGDDSDNSLPMENMTVAKITGNGTYTVAIDLTGGFTGYGEGGVPIVDEESGEPVVYTKALGIGAMGINANFSSDNTAYDNFMMNITSVKFDGVETMEADVVSYTNNEDGIKRANVFNSYADFDEDKADHLTTDKSKATSVLTKMNGEWAKCEVTFEVTGLAETPDGQGDDTTPAEAEDTTPAEAEDTTPTPGGSNGNINDTNNPGTGVEGIAVVVGLAVIATGAIVVAKKRK